MVASSQLTSSPFNQIFFVGWTMLGMIGGARPAHATFRLGGACASYRLAMPDATFVIQMFDAIDRGDFARLGEFFARDVVYERPGYEPLRGLDELDHFYRHVRIVERGRHDLAAVTFGEGQAACWGRFVGQARDGCELNERFADCYEFDGDGKIVLRTTFFYRAAM
jgi:ketosteroid isomerase-like protein